MPSFLNAALSEEDGICQISIDDSRNILYTLSEKGSIEVCDLGEKGNSFSKIEKMTQATLVNLAMNTVKYVDVKILINSILLMIIIHKTVIFVPEP